MRNASSILWGLLAGPLALALMALAWFAFADGSTGAPFLPVIIGRMRELTVSGPFLSVLETSLTTLVVGIVIAFLIALPLGVLARSAPILRRILGPLYAAISGFPAAALSGLAMIWVGLTPTMAFVMVVMSSVFPIALAITGQVRPEPPPAPAGVAPWPTYALPGGVRPRPAMPAPESFGPDLVAALRWGLAWGLVGLIIAETITGSRGVFGFVENAMRLSDIPLAIAALALMAVPTMLIGGLLFGIEQKLAAK